MSLAPIIEAVPRNSIPQITLGNSQIEIQSAMESIPSTTQSSDVQLVVAVPDANGSFWNLTITIGLPQAPSTLSSSADPPPATCDQLCDSLASCSKATKGSYCKLANSPSTCFGLYWKTSPDGKRIVCYAGDEGCPDTDPVLCSSADEVPIIL